MTPHQEIDNQIFLLGKKLTLKQPADGFKTGLDAVMLASACPLKAGQTVLDLGCGVGSAGFCVLKRVEGAHLTGVEIQENHVALAQVNAELNNYSKQVEFINADIRSFKCEQKFDHVICNPPYLETGAHLRSPSDEKATAMGHDDDDLTIQDWVDCARRSLSPNGSLTLIHRADFVDKIIQALESKFGAVEIIPLWPKAGTEAKRVIIRALKGRKTPARIHAGLILHDAEGEYTLEAEKILRDAGDLNL